MGRNPVVGKRTRLPTSQEFVASRIGLMAEPRQSYATAIDRCRAAQARGVIAA